jgi:competence protein ComEA
MSEITHAQVAMYAVAAVLVVVLGVRYMHRQAGVANRAPVASAGAGAGGDSTRSAAPDGAVGGPATVRIDASGGGAALVHVAGAVRHPGVYRLSAGARIQDAVRRAGGATGAADVDAVNLAAKVADGQQVIVPRRASAGGAAGGVPSAASGGAAPAGGPTAGPVNLNTATAEQLDTLDGVGPATAEKILDWRRQHGGFRTVEDLAQVPGIGPKRLAALRGKVQL